MTRRSFVSGRTLVAVAVMAVAAMGVTVWYAARALQAAEREVQAARQIRFVVRPMAPLVDPGFEAISSPAIFLEAAKFDGHLFLAGPAGLFEYDPAGAPVRT